MRYARPHTTPARTSWLDRPTMVAAGLVLAVSGCVTDVEPPRQSIWETSLTSLDHPDMSGTAAAVSRGTGTQASIAVVGLQEGAYVWAVYRGACAEPVDVLGSEEMYPALDVDVGGHATADASVPRPMLIERSYLAQVLTVEGERVACGDFVPWQ